LEEIGYYDILARDTKTDFSLRNLIFYWRMNTMKLFIHTVMRTPTDWWKLFHPNLEVKFAIDEVEKLGSHLLLMEEELSSYTFDALRHEKAMDFVYPMLRYIFGINESWMFEAKDKQKLFRCHKLKILTEEHFNKDAMAWFVRFADLMVPK
jgi:hypothetical protein